MANEYLKRTPTSTGNQKVWTVSTWIKQIDITGTSGNGSFLFGYYDEGASPTPRGSIQINESAVDGKHSIGWNPTGNTWYQTTPEGRYRDNQNWYHLLVAIDTTKSAESDGVQMYFNGVKRESESYLGTWGSGAAALNIDTGFNSLVEHYIGAFAESVIQSKLQYSDFFYIDGQQLGPDVFGFYKDGNGYISAGSTQATDFRPGQWVPKAPRIIKTEINRRGGFGVNGFYLPMNDSSNFGADFHTTPNSIITLKGEDLPQPRNGAPTTTDAYVSQLRTDPYAANLVLAVPGISTATGPNLVSNGTFDSNTTGWTAGNSAILSVENGALKIQGDGVTISGYATQQITTVIGERYTVNFDVIDSSSSAAWIRIGTTGGGVQVASKNNNAEGTHSISFTATATATYITLMITVGNATRYTIVDNIVVRQEDAPLDYSADIKGSGTNKTLTANGNAGVGYEIPSYYGSALSFDGNGDTLTTTDNTSDYQFGTGNFTIESWFKKDANGTTDYDGLAQLYNAASPNGSGADGWFLEVSSTRGIVFASDDGTSYVVSYDGASSINTGQWQHLAICRKDTTATIFLNGVAVGINTNFASNITSGDTLRIGTYGAASNFYFNGYIQDLRVYKGVAKYKGGFDVPKPYTPVGIGTWRAVPDTTANNFCTLNPLNKDSSNSLSNGNLTVLTSSSGQGFQGSTIGISTGKWYWEIRVDDNSGNTSIGIASPEFPTTTYVGGSGSISYGYFASNGNKVNNGSAEAYGSTYTTGDIMGVSLDSSNGTLTYYKNGTSQGTAFSSLSGTFLPAISDISSSSSSTLTANFGQNPTFSGTTTAGTYTDSNGKGLFKYEPPSGFLALCEDNLPTPAIKNPGEHFKTVLYTGSASPRGIVGVGFTPDLVWVKSRINPASGIFNTLVDSVRGAPLALYSNSSDSEDNPGGSSNPASVYGGISSFDNDGFSIISGSVDTQLNNSGTPYVAWCWRAGAGTTTANTAGSIQSVVSVNQDAGFSIVSYTGNGTVGATVGHGLGKKPKFFMTKNRDTAALDWPVFSEELLGSNGYIYLNKTNAAATIANISGPTSSVLTLSGYNDNNKSGDRFIAYCWAEIEGFSKFGSYVGNANADGPFVYCGFKPAWVMVKRSSAGENWAIIDSSRNSTNVADKFLRPDESSIETTAAANMDLLSNGFKLRGTDTKSNGSGTYIFAAFAESPFTTANAK